MTVVLGATSNIGSLTPLIAKSRQDTRNCFASARRRDTRWHDTYLRGWHEIDAVGADHLPILPPDQKSLIPALAPMAAQTSLPTWIATWHGVMFRNGLSDDEIKCQFRRQWKLNHQVDVQPLDEEKPVTDNLNELSSYPNKFHTTTSLAGGFKDPWPVSWGRSCSAGSMLLSVIRLRLSSLPFNSSVRGAGNITTGGIVVF